MPDQTEANTCSLGEVKMKVYGGIGLKLSVTGCSGCGEDHSEQEFRPINSGHPMLDEGFTHRTFCQKSERYVYMKNLEVEKMSNLEVFTAALNECGLQYKQEVTERQQKTTAALEDRAGLCDGPTIPSGMTRVSFGGVYCYFDSAGEFVGTVSDEVAFFTPSTKNPPCPGSGELVLDDSVNTYICPRCESLVSVTTDDRKERHRTSSFERRLVLHRRGED